jgi:hypothetical protein
MILKANYELTEKSADALIGTMADETHYDRIIDEDCDCYTANGKPLFFLRKNYIEEKTLLEAVDNMESAAKPTSNRGSSSGGERKRNVTKDGKKTKTLQVYDKETGKVVQDKSGIVGYFDRSGHYDFCRTTAFNKEHLDKFQKAMPLINAVNQGFKELVPSRWKKQYGMVLGTDPNYRIGKTAFSTITVNKDYRTAFHKDAGDYAEGFGNLVAYCKDIEPVYLVLPRFRVAINLENYDLLLVDVHEVHGNTEIIKKSDKAKRISFVMYYRQNMIKCLSPEKELQRIKDNQRIIGQKYIEGVI